MALPLPDEVRTTLSLLLASELGTADIGTHRGVGGRRVLQVSVLMRRFDSAPGRYVAEEAVWSLRSNDGVIAVEGCAMYERKAIGWEGEAVALGHH